MGFVIRLLINAVALLAVAYVVPGIHVSGFWSAVLVALILGIVNAILRPILFIITLPLQILTLGLFTLVINALLFWLVGTWHLGLYVDGFWPAFWGALVMTIVSWILSALTGSLDGDRNRRVAR
jgi:putative membrane protein